MLVSENAEIVPVKKIALEIGDIIPHKKFAVNIAELAFLIFLSFPCCYFGRKSTNCFHNKDFSYDFYFSVFFRSHNKELSLQ